MKSTSSAPAAFQNSTSFSFDDLITCGKGLLFGPGNPQLPLPPMLMFDRITHIAKTGGRHDKGEVIAELDVNEKLWFFACHFQGDPVMPGCLGLDAMWQLVGFFLGWLGGEGRGRALGVGEVKFKGMVVPSVKRVTYRIDLKRVMMRRLILAVADGTLEADGEPIFHASDLKVGVFKPGETQGD